MQDHSLEPTELILGNSNPRFSGVTSTMLQVLEYQKEFVSLAVLGKHHLPAGIQTLSLRQAFRLCQKPLEGGRARIFHARRNNEALQALLLRALSKAPLRLAFTSTAQREHSWITRWIIKKSDAVITTSSAANAYIEGGADFICPHGVDLERYHPSENRAALWQKLGLPGKFGIGIFGRVRHQKGVDVLVDAVLPLMDQYPEFTIVVCGETTSQHQAYVDALKAKIAANDLTDRFVFLGKRPFSELPKLFRAMHLVAALSRNEGFGLTVLEAMASGVAVLASQAGAWQDIVIEGETGHIVPCNDVEATRQTLDSIMSNISLLEKMGERGRHCAEEKYSLETEATSLTQFLLGLQNQGSPEDLLNEDGKIN